MGFFGIYIIQYASQELRSKGGGGTIIGLTYSYVSIYL